MSLSSDSLESFFRSSGRIAIACSGGTDSTFLVHEGAKMGADIVPIIIRSQLACHGEVEGAVEFCRSQGVEPVVVDVDAMSVEGLLANGPDRCYLCKKAMFGAVTAKARELGCDVVADGTNASDPVEDRPGMRALAEMGVRSPLRDAGLTKSQIRRLSRTERLSTWNKLSNSCLATRVATGVRITPEIVERVGNSEDAIGLLGFTGFRVRTDGTDARLELRASEREAAVRRIDEIRKAVSPWFDDISISEVTRDG
ncbi:MAG: ATP-dependent sacrificial sulfur transferase LarE [Thermoplasmata archaeon]|nr:ATP-dependent sacrificial sulfur transferase LarE [Thermoplasmata archaeon]